jgi:hypothetical protein
MTYASETRKACRDCAFCDVYVDPDVSDSSRHHHFCRRHAPNLMCRVSADDEWLNFPPVKPDGWCGDHTFKTPETTIKVIPSYGPTAGLRCRDCYHYGDEDDDGIGRCDLHGRQCFASATPCATPDWTPRPVSPPVDPRCATCLDPGPRDAQGRCGLQCIPQMPTPAQPAPFVVQVQLPNTPDAPDVVDMCSMCTRLLSCDKPRKGHRPNLSCPKFRPFS